MMPAPKPPLLAPISIDLRVRFGKDRFLRLAARASPAGLVAIGLLVSSILLAVAPLVRAAKSPAR